MVPFESFKQGHVPVRSAACGDIDIHCRSAGKGPGLLLLHGYPQTSHIWRFVAPELARHFLVVAADLRGYGRSSKPIGSQSHVEYSKREMAQDMVQVMQHFGMERFSIFSHDRGARVAHRLAIDHPERVERLILLDIAPTLYMYEKTDMQFAMGYWHWFFMPQPAPGPEDIMLANPDLYWAMSCGRASHTGVRWTEEDVTEYRSHYFTPKGVHAACEDYRASASIDLEHDKTSRANGAKIQTASLLVLWGKKGIINAYPQPLKIWQDYCSENVIVSGKAIDSGHYLVEEAPEAVMEEVAKFFGINLNSE